MSNNKLKVIEKKTFEKHDKMKKFDIRPTDTGPNAQGKSIGISERPMNTYRL